MATTCGFYNAVKQEDGTYDRVYNAEQLGNMFEGIISDGVYEAVDDALIVKSKSGMTVEVGAGRAVAGSKWLKNDAKKDITLAASHATLNRWSAIAVRFDHSNRTADIIEIAGTVASSPTKPLPVHTDSTDDLFLAYIYVAKGASEIRQMDISDVRADNNVCGWVTGVVVQVNTSQLFLQYQDAYEKQLATMQDWQKQQEEAFDTWFSTLTNQLQVNTYVDQYHKVVELTTSQDTFSLDMTGYEYASTDIFLVNVNGIMLVRDKDYSVDLTKSLVQIKTTEDLDAYNIVEISILKSRVGQP